MKIYFSCSITGGRQDQGIYQLIVKYLERRGHEVLTHHLAEPDMSTLDLDISPSEVYRRDMQWLNECAILIAEVSTPSHGVGYEIAIALNRHLPVFCCARQDTRVSKILTGNSSEGYSFYRYTDQSDLENALATFLAKQA